jgi:ribosomal protein L15/outer membrane biosynthesis protein TonB
MYFSALFAISASDWWPIAAAAILVVAIVIIVICHFVNKAKANKGEKGTPEEDEPQPLAEEDTYNAPQQVNSDEVIIEAPAPIIEPEPEEAKAEPEPVEEAKSEPVEEAKPEPEEKKPQRHHRQLALVVVEEDEKNPAPVEYVEPTESYATYYNDEYDGPYEAVAEETIPEEATAVDEQLSVNDENGDVAEVLKRLDSKTGTAYVVRYKKSFFGRLIQSWEESKAYYTELKNEILSYPSVKSRVSWEYDSFSAGGNTLIKIDVRGKTLCLYYSLNPDDYADTKYKVERSQIKKCEDVPCLYRIKNPTRVSNAKELIAQVMKNNGIERGEKTRRDSYEFPYQTTQELVEENLAKEYFVKEKYEDFLQKRVKNTEEEVANEQRAKRSKERAKMTKMRREKVEADEVDVILSDDFALDLVEDERTEAEKIGKKDYGKKGIINIDAISANYEKGEIVNLESLKQKGLIAQNIGYVKVLANGILTKPLTIEAQDFSVEAVKMIVLTGGTAVKV